MIHNDTQINIMTGGIGRRFCPMPTPDCPKQFIGLMGVGNSLIQLTVDRLKPICPVENISTNEKIYQHRQGANPRMPIDKHPCRARGTQHCTLHRLCSLEDTEAAFSGEYRGNIYMVMNVLII